MLDNYAVKNPDATWTTFAGPDNRYIFPTGGYLYNATVKDACVLANTNKGYGYTLNLTLNAEPVKNLDTYGCLYKNRNERSFGYAWK